MIARLLIAFALSGPLVLVGMYLGYCLAVNNPEPQPEQPLDDIDREWLAYAEGEL